MHDLPHNGQFLHSLLDSLDHPIRNADGSQLGIGLVVEILLFGDVVELEHFNEVIDLLSRQVELLGCHRDDLFDSDRLQFDDWLVFWIILALVHGNVFMIRKICFGCLTKVCLGELLCDFFIRLIRINCG